MSNNEKRDANWSLQGEIKKRKTQEIQREILEKRQTQSMRPAQANGSGSTTSPSESSLPKRATQTMPPVGADPRRTSQTMQQVDPRRTSQTMQAVSDPRRTSQTMQPVDPRRASQTMQQVDPRRTSQTMQAVSDPRRTSQTMAPVDPRRASQTMQPVDPRRASQTMQQVDPRRTSQTMQAVADPRRTSQTMRQVDPRRTSQTMAAVQSLVDAKRVSQTLAAVQDTGRMLRVTAEEISTSVETMKPAQKRALVASLVGVITLIALMSSVLMIGKAIAPPTRVIDGTAYVIQPTLAKLPTASAQGFVDYLKQYGVQVFNQTQEVISSRWHAAQEISVDIPYGTQGQSAKFYILGYDPSNKYMGFDLMFFSAYRPPYSDLKGWQYMTASNMLVITSPNTPPEIYKMVLSHFNTMLLAPGMSNYPNPTQTPTPGPSPTPKP